MYGSLREVITSYKGKDPFANMGAETIERLTNEPALTTNGGEV
jgi:ABC-2 type transport system ATP-binding protein